VLTLATFRLLRLIGWDEFPPVAIVRERMLKGRDLLGHLWGCPFCLGFWVSVIVYVLWLWHPTVVMYAAAPFALSAAIGLIAKGWDA